MTVSSRGSLSRGQLGFADLQRPDQVVAGLGELVLVSATELPTASGVGRMVLYALVTRLDQSSETATEQLPGRATGYRLTAAR